MICGDMPWNDLGHGYYRDGRYIYIYTHDYIYTHNCNCIYVYIYIGNPQNGWFIVENSQKQCMLWGYPPFIEAS